MSAVQRILSANVAGLFATATIVATQVGVVPLLLHHWSAEQLGYWLALQTAVLLLTLPGLSHLDYCGYEAMRDPQDRQRRCSKIISDALPAIVLTGIFELLAAWGLSLTVVPRFAFAAPSAAALISLNHALIGLVLIWVVFQVPVNLLSRILSAIGHYTAVAWWFVVLTLAQSAALVISVACGAQIEGAAWAYGGATVITFLIQLGYWLRLARKRGLWLQSPDLATGLKRLRQGLSLSISAMLEFLQQAGYRLILLPCLGALRLVQFATTRTLSQSVQTGVTVFFNPVVPELMRVIGLGDRARASLLMTGLFALVVFGVCPGFLVIQAAAPWIFAKWTLGKIAYDGYVFAALSFVIMIAGIGQPSRAIIRGNNLVSAQNTVSIMTALVQLSMTLLTAPRFGVIGAAVAVLMGETVRTVMLTRIARDWLRNNGFDYPLAPALVSLATVIISGALLMAMAWAPHQRWTVLLIALAAMPATGRAFYCAMATDERAVLAQLMAKLPVWPAASSISEANAVTK